jgi:hypothetical protein
MFFGYDNEADMRKHNPEFADALISGCQKVEQVRSDGTRYLKCKATMSCLDPKFEHQFVWAEEIK